MLNSKEQKEIYTELVGNYNFGVKNQDPKVLTAFVKDDRILLFKQEDSAEEYCSLRLFRAECFTLFEKFSSAKKECRLALAFEVEERKWLIYMEWSRLLFLEFLHSKGKDSLHEIAKEAVLTAQRGRKSIIKGKNFNYKQLALAHTEAFFSLYLGDRKTAKQSYIDITFKPIPISQYNNESELGYLLSSYAKGFAAAIELQDEKLLRNLMKVISIDDHVLYGDDKLFKVFHSTLINTIDTRSEFRTEFNQLFQINDKVSDEMKQLNFFLISIQSNLHIPLTAFFDLFK